MTRCIAGQETDRAKFMITEMMRVFGRIGLLSFGGPAAQIALMHKELVEDRRWLTEEEYLRALSFCMLLPGPEAMQLVTYAGWKRYGTIGGLIGGGLFVLPGALVILVLALAYSSFGDLQFVQAAFLGVKATVVIIVVQALIKVAGRALKGPLYTVLAVAGFLALFFFALPFPFVIAIAAVSGAAFAQKQAQASKTALPDLGPSLRVALIGAVIWAVPLVAVWMMDQKFLFDVGMFFSKLAIVTFGGAYAVLAYMTQEVVDTYGWLSTTQMMDALGLAETTPGPLILVTQFVSMIAGYAQNGTGTALLAGLLTLWVTFVPCFIWIFAGAPLISWIEGRPRLQGALAGVTAAVVGVIANLSLWFALHVFFGTVNAVSFGPIQTIWPQLSTLEPLAVLLAIFAAALLLWRRWGLPQSLLTISIVGMLLQPGQIGL